MKISSTSFRQLLRNISEAVSGKKSAIDYIQSNRDMKISSTSFRQLLRNISEAVSAKKSAIDYDDLLQKIFKETAAHVEALADSELRYLLQNKYFPFDEKVFGRDHEKEMLLSKLFDPIKKGIELSVIPILGGCGIGKTTLARLVYDDKMVKEHFQLQAWVEVSGQEFRLLDAAQGLVKSAIGISCCLDQQHELDEMLRDTLQSQRCLIVFDGVESMAKNSWLYIKQLWFSVVGSGSKVLITTSSSDISYLVDDNPPFELRQLSQDAGWSLCRFLAFGSSSEGTKDMSSPMAKNFAALCRGNPLSLRLVGCLMRYDDRLRSLLSFVDFSEDCILLPPSDASSLVILLCAWSLPQHLRQCFAYCSVFPKGYALNKEKIIKMWIADGLVKPSPGNNSLEDIGDAYFRQLLCRSFFTDLTYNQYGDIIKFRMPGLIHTTAEHVARTVLKEKLGVIGSIGTEDAAQLSLVLQSFAGKYKSEHMRTLILSPTLYLGGGNDLHHSLLEFKGLQSLDLSCSGIRNLTDDICELKEIRYLNLSHTLIERLPDPITDLSQLQTLDLSWCYRLKVLPKGMRNLTRMSHLDLSLCNSLSHLPSGIGFLLSLKSMPLFVLGKDHADCARLGELGALRKLRGRLEIRNLENVSEISEPEYPLLKQKSLDHLVLSWNQKADYYYYSSLLRLLEPSPCLKVLDLTGYNGWIFPTWIDNMHGLVKISISNSQCSKLPLLARLPFLKELQLKSMMRIRFLPTSSNGSVYGYDIHDDDDVFPSLEQLWLYDLPLLSDWSVLPSRVSGGSPRRVFPKLKTLTVEGCPRLQTLQSLPTLTDLIVCNTNDHILSSLTSFKSLSSLLIRDMGLGVSFGNLSSLNSLKKLILINIKDLGTSNLFMQKFSVLEHLGIRRCSSLQIMNLANLTSLEKLHIVNCPNLDHIRLANNNLIELVVEDCPIALYFASSRPRALRKLIIKGCHMLRMAPQQFEQLKGLEYLFISGCPQLETQLQKEPSLKSHIPCVILGNHKANYKDTEEYLSLR